MATSRVRQAASRRGGGTLWSFDHDQAGRPAGAAEGGAVNGTYLHDGLERLAIRTVTNTTPSGTIHSIHDTAGHVLAEADGTTGLVQREYIWLDIVDEGAASGPMRRPANDNDRADSGRLGAAESDDDPSARARLPSLRWPTSRIAPRAVPLMAIENASAVTPGVMYVHADHLDRPVRMTAQTKAGLWTAVYRPFGDVHSIGGTRSLDLRFPGQWFQLETGLHYNWHRHYDPTTGRYLQPDPLGLVDGAGVYGYAGGSPQQYVDRDGLNPLVLVSGFCSRFPARCSAAVKSIVDFCLKSSGGGSGAGPRREDTPECKKEWEVAERICSAELSKPRHMQSRAVTGGHRSIEGCTKGFVSEACGGNSIR